MSRLYLRLQGSVRSPKGGGRAGAVQFGSKQLKWHGNALPNSLRCKMARNSVKFVGDESSWECFKEKP